MIFMYIYRLNHPKYWAKVCYKNFPSQQRNIFLFDGDVESSTFRIFQNMSHRILNKGSLQRIRLCFFNKLHIEFNQLFLVLRRSHSVLILTLHWVRIQYITMQSKWMINNKFNIMKSSVAFTGLSLTEIFEIQPIQSLLIKFWYLGLTSDCLIAKEDVTTFKTIKKTLNFANCFTFEMPLKTYINFADRLMKPLSEIEPKIIFDVLLTHLKNNSIKTVSFQLFGVALLQLFGKVLQLMDSQILGQMLRKVYVEITLIGKSGTAILKTDKTQIGSLDFEEFVPGYKEHLLADSMPKKDLLNPENSQEGYMSEKNSPQLRDMKTIKGRLESQHQFNSSLRGGESGMNYPVGQKMKSKDQASLSCFMMGGFEIVDYSQSINQLHRKLLTKILLNK